MQKLPLDVKLDELPRNTFLLYGDTRTGKTTFAASFPRPYIICDKIEGGYKSIQNMDRSTWFEEDFEPMMVAPDTMADVATVINTEVTELIARKRVMTIVFDAFSFYVDFFLAGLMKAQGDKVDNRKAYGNLGIHLREVRNVMHSKGVNVVWNCLARHPDDDHPVGGPLISGQQGDKFSAGVDFLWYSRVDQKIEGGKVTKKTFEMHTEKYLKYVAGHREGIYAGNLPNPFVGTYTDLLPLLGFDVERVRANMPKVLPATAKPVAVIAPPAPKPPALVQRSAPKVVTVPPTVGKTANK